MTTRAVAYIRRSTADEGNPGDTSRAVQETAIRDLAKRDGNTIARWFVDWGKSGDEAKISKRTAYASMMGEVADGKVAVVYAYALDRLHRSVIETGKMMAAIRDQRVTITTQMEGTISEDDPSKWLTVTMTATMGEYALRQMKVRARANIVRRKERGDAFGVAPYGLQVDPRTHRFVANPGEDVSAVAEAYERGGSIAAAAHLLNEDPELIARAPARRGEHWADTTVGRILRRSGHVGASTRQGWSPKYAADSFALYRLIVCPHDGLRLTAQRSTATNGGVHVRYFCSRARWDPKHPRPYAVAESIILPWVKEQAGEGTRTLVSTETLSSSANQERRATLERQRKNLGRALVDETIDEDEYTALKDAIDTELAELPEAGQRDVTFNLRRFHVVRFDDEPGALGRALSEVIESIVLDTNIRPVRIEVRAKEEAA